MEYSPMARMQQSARCCFSENLVCYALEKDSALIVPPLYW